MRTPFIGRSALVRTKSVATGSRISPAAAASPPPTTMTSGSKMFAKELSATPRHSPTNVSSARASRSPSSAQRTTPGASVSASPRSRARRATAVPEQ